MCLFSFARPFKLTLLHADALPRPFILFIASFFGLFIILIRLNIQLVSFPFQFRTIQFYDAHPQQVGFSEFLVLFFELRILIVLSILF